MGPTQVPQAGPMGAAIAAVLGILMFAGVIIGYIVFLVAMWRLMKAHESLAQSAREFVDRGAGGGGMIGKS